ncbi:MAG TPA: prophage tail fiber N-terminal domain-containing protein [Buttiauxella sp.]
MSVNISGVLNDALGKPVINCTVRLTATRTSATVIATTRGEQQPDAAGSYSLDVEPGRYKVSLMIPGWPPEDVGRIEVTAYSQPGTLNDFLTRTQSGDLSLDIMARFEQLAAQVADEARQTAKDSHDADNSATAAKTSEINAAASATASAESATHAHSSETAAKASETRAEGSATAAAASQVAATASEGNAKNSETAAAGSKTAAATSETSAASSATAAKTSETNASASATAAHTSETRAAGSATTAADNATASAASQVEAKTSESNTKASATAAKTSETNAAASATASGESATHAHSSETAAKASETRAEESATAAAVSQAAATASEGNAKNSETAAAGSKAAAATSETSAASSATAAKTSETNASASAIAAHTSETNAHASEQAAAQHAADAQGVVAGTGRLIALKKIEVSGIYTPSPGAKFIIFEVTGAGGSGTTLNAHPSWIYTPGGDGGYVKFMDTDVQPSYPITIGAPLPGEMGGSTTIGFPGGRRVVAWGGNASSGVIFDGTQPSEPRQILVGAGGGFDLPDPLLLLDGIARAMEITYLASLRAGTSQIALTMTGPCTPLGYKRLNEDIASVYQYVASTGYGAGSPGYWPGVSGVVDESILSGRPGVVFAWEYS